MAGITLIELMVVIAIVSITLTVGVPSLRTLFANNRIAGQTNAFIGSLYLARSEAVKRNQIVQVVSGGDWNTGWQVLADTDGDGNGDLLLQSVEALTGGTTFTAAASNTISFNGRGTVTAGNGNYVLNNPNASSTRNITVQPMGRFDLMCGASTCI